MLAFLQQIEHLGGMLTLAAVARSSNDLKVGLICGIGSAQPPRLLENAWLGICVSHPVPSKQWSTRQTRLPTAPMRSPRSDISISRGHPDLLASPRHPRTHPLFLISTITARRWRVQGGDITSLSPAPPASMPLDRLHHTSMTAQHAQAVPVCCCSGRCWVAEWCGLVSANTCEPRRRSASKRATSKNGQKR